MFYVTCKTCKEFWLTCKNRDSRQISSFSKKIGEIPTKFHQNLASKWQNSIKKCWKLKISLFIFEKSLTIFDWNFEVWAVQKYANLVDRVKSFPTSIYLQKSASIQPRTSLSKFGGNFNPLFIRLLNSHDNMLLQLERISQLCHRPHRFLIGSDWLDGEPAKMTVFFGKRKGCVRSLRVNLACPL